MKKCKHKYHETRNEEIGGYNIPDGVTTEYDIYCKDCGEKLGHWVYGLTDIEYYLNYELKGIKKLRAKFKYYVLDSIKNYIINKKYKNDNDLPF